MIFAFKILAQYNLPIPQVYIHIAECYTKPGFLNIDFATTSARNRFLFLTFGSSPLPEFFRWMMVITFFCQDNSVLAFLPNTLIRQFKIIHYGLELN